MYAADGDFVAHSEDEIQNIMEYFSRTCTAFRSTINLKKTKIIDMPSPELPYIETNIIVNGSRLEAVDTFVYLDSALSLGDSLDAEVNRRIERATQAFRKQLS